MLTILEVFVITKVYKGTLFLKKTLYAAWLEAGLNLICQTYPITNVKSNDTGKVSTLMV